MPWQIQAMGIIIIIIIEPQFALGRGGTLQASYCGIMASAADCEVARPGFDPGSENVHVEWKRPNQQRRLLVPSYVGSLCYSKQQPPLGPERARWSQLALSLPLALLEPKGGCCFGWMKFLSFTCSELDNIYNMCERQNKV